ncbi:MAG: 4a-hydroxytetrahydrobiopterin dehydratase [Halobacteriota archaeon]|jgi:4a-hydroxytetrahydrobiopterin dehydratase
MSNEGTTDASRLTAKHCVPCEVGTQPFDLETINGLLPMVSKWKLEDATKLTRSFRFNNFIESMRFINDVAQLAEAEGHHPDIFVSYSYVRISLTTHNIGGLSENDFIMAAKIDEIFAKNGA